MEDIIIESKQAIEMCNIYQDILSRDHGRLCLRDLNNLNIVMKYLASITIILAIPTDLFPGFGGMNVANIPLRIIPWDFGSSLGYPPWRQESGP